jgi:hypothetical protein
LKSIKSQKGTQYKTKKVNSFYQKLISHWRYFIIFY